MNVLIFDIETIPDTQAGRKLHHLSELNDLEVAQAMFLLRRQDHGTEFLPHYLQQIVAISVLMRCDENGQNLLKVWSLGDPQSNEAELIQRFFDGLHRLNPTLVSWNGGGFDLPVLHYRALLHGIEAPRYWENGENEANFRYNNYLSRYHYRHMDLMDILSGYQARAAAPLDNLAKILGFPGKLGKSGAQVWQQYFADDIQGIRDYCETDVLNTYLIFLRFQLMRGKLSLKEYQQECSLLQQHLLQANQPHLTEFLQAWNYEHTI